MGFFGALGKVLSGKPVYTPAEEAAKQQQGQSQPAPTGQSAQPEPAGPLPQAGPKQPPAVGIGRVECVMNGGRMDVHIDLVNQSSEPVFIDDITLLGTRHELQRELRPGETRQEFVYSGQPFTQQPQGYAELRFRRQSDGDYYLNYYNYYCVQQANGTYFIGQFRPTGPTKDI